MQDAFLEIREPSGVRRIPLGRDPLTVGRHSENRIMLTDHMASRFHCIIGRSADGYWVRDLNSSNGTSLNGKLVRSAPMQPGDTISIGSVKMVLLAGNGAAPPEPRHAPLAPQIIESEGLPEPVDLADIVNPVVIEDDPPEPLTDADIVEDEPIEMVGSGEAAPQPDAGREPEDVVEAIAESLPDKPFGENEIGLINTRGQLVHPPSASPPPRGRRDAVNWLRLLLLICSRGRVTDVHFEPKGDGYVIRMRIDGTMIEVARISNPLGAKLSALVKVLSEIDISQRNAIQEGHFGARVPGAKLNQPRRIDYRVSFAPSVYGQKLVIRVLDTTYAPLTVSALQLPAWMQQEVEQAIKRDAGMVLACGPTGSGKTTSLYALIRGSDIARRNVVTIEDPVEIQIEGVTQIPVDEEQGRSFSSLLRSILRQDPDVILIGEIRDAETARIAMQAAITGHLVFSTVHTQHTVGTVFRLLDLGVEPYLVAQALHLVLAQRLARQLCPYCKSAVKPTGEQLERMGSAGAGVKTIFVSKGCPRCLHTGFSGRRAIFELLRCDDAVRDLIAHNATMAQIQTALASTPFQRLQTSGYQLVAEGAVPFDEVERVIGREQR